MLKVFLIVILKQSNKCRHQKPTMISSFIFIREMGHAMKFKPVPARSYSLAMIQNEYVFLLNGNTKVVVREKTASFKDGSFTGFPI